MPINYIRREIEKHIQSLIPPILRQAPTAVDKIILWPPFADNMENLEMLTFNCVKSR